MNKTPGGIRSLVACSLLAALPLLLGGCNMGKMFSAMFYDPQADAEYEVGKGPLLVVVEDFAGSGGDPTIRFHLTRTLHDELQKNKVNKQVVPDKSLWDYQKMHPVSARWNEQKLGKALAADQVLHVQMVPYVVSPNSPDPTEHARLACAVRVIDVASGDQIWPLEGTGREVKFEVDAADLHGVAPGDELKRTLARGLGDQVAKLFYKHKLTDREASRRAAGGGSF